jgi:hypothetical protein
MDRQQDLVCHSERTLHSGRIANRNSAVYSYVEYLRDTSQRVGPGQYWNYDFHYVSYFIHQRLALHSKHSSIKKD